MTGLLFSIVGQPVALAKEPIELTMVHFGPAPIFETRCAKEFFVKRVNEEAKGKLKITVKGGPEIMTPFDQLKWVEPDQDLSTIMEILTGDDINQVPVVENSDIVGMIARDKLLSFVSVRSELGM